MKQPSFRQARINNKNTQGTLFEGQIVEVIEILTNQKLALIRINSHAIPQKVDLSSLDL